MRPWPHAWRRPGGGQAGPTPCGSSGPPDVWGARPAGFKWAWDLHTHSRKPPSGPVFAGWCIGRARASNCPENLQVAPKRPGNSPGSPQSRATGAAPPPPPPGTLSDLWDLGRSAHRNRTDDLRITRKINPLKTPSTRGTPRPPPSPGVLLVPPDVQRQPRTDVSRSGSTHDGTRGSKWWLT